MDAVPHERANDDKDGMLDGVSSPTSRLNSRLIRTGLRVAFIARCAAPRLSEKIIKATTALCSAEELLEEIAEAGAAEMEFIVAAIPGAPCVRCARRRREAARLPVGAELIVFSPFLGIAENLVRFVDLFELLLGVFLSFAMSGWYSRASLRNAFLISSCDVARHAEHRVVVFELNRHRRSF